MQSVFIDIGDQMIYLYISYHILSSTTRTANARAIVGVSVGLCQSCARAVSEYECLRVSASGEKRASEMPAMFAMYAYYEVI